MGEDSPPLLPPGSGGDGGAAGNHQERSTGQEDQEEGAAVTALEAATGSRCGRRLDAGHLVADRRGLRRWLWRWLWSRRRGGRWRWCRRGRWLRLRLYWRGRYDYHGGRYDYHGWYDYHGRRYHRRGRRVGEVADDDVARCRRERHASVGRDRRWRRQPRAASARGPSRRNGLRDRDQMSGADDDGPESFAVADCAKRFDRLADSRSSRIAGQHGECECRGVRCRRG